MSTDPERRWKVGELARTTGLTVRALHHYDEIGLLVPSERSTAGHRLYAEGDVRRLYRIVALRRLGLGLEETGSLLDESSVTLIETVRRHLDQVERELEHQHRLRDRLRRILDALERSVDPAAEDYIDALESMTMIEVAVSDVLMRLPNDEGHRVVLLREQTGQRVLHIWIGAPEGDALVRHRSGQEPSRPQGWDLTAKLLSAGGVRVERVVIERIHGNTFYATVVIATNGEWHEVDARPSDALNVAARLTVPVFVATEVMDQAATGPHVQLGECGNQTDLDRRSKSAGEWRSATPALMSCVHRQRLTERLERQMTEPAREAMRLAQENAQAFAHDHVAPEHILLGLLAQKNTAAARVLESFQVTVELARAQASRIQGSGQEAVSEDIPLSPRASAMLESVLYWAVVRGLNDVGPEHILLGLAGAEDNLLLELGVEAQQVRIEIDRLEASRRTKPRANGSRPKKH